MNAYKKLEPVIYKAQKRIIRGIFDVPVNNTIASNRIENGITLINFSGEKVKYKSIKKNFLDYVSSGNDIHLPIFSEDKIGYSLGRGFLLFNIKNKKYNYYSIAGNFNYEIYGIDVVNAEENIYLFTIGMAKLNDDTKYMRLVDLSTESVKIINEKKVESGWWITLGKMIFFYDLSDIKAMNMDFEKVSHPLIDAFYKEKPKDFGKVSEITIHPFLPFAVIRESKDNAHSFENNITIWIISWGNKELNLDKSSMIKLLQANGNQFKFSYDGKWLFFFDSTHEPEKYMIMPVQESQPYFLGKPITLGDVPEYLSGARAMTRNPSGLVISECDDNDRGNCCFKKWIFSDAQKLIEKKVLSVKQ